MVDGFPETEILNEIESRIPYRFLIEKCLNLLEIAPNSEVLWRSLRKGSLPLWLKRLKKKASSQSLWPVIKTSYKGSHLMSVVRSSKKQNLLSFLKIQKTASRKRWRIGLTSDI